MWDDLLINMNNNRGMFLETIINRTIEYFENKKVAYLSKRYLPVKIYSFHGNQVQGWLKEKTQTDYYGIYNGHYLDFEAKQTLNNSFIIANLRKHQYEHLIKVSNFGAISFLIVYFAKADYFFVLDFNSYVDFIKANPELKKIDLSFFENNGYLVELIYPGVLDLEPVLKQLIKNRHLD